jgi:prepilin-type N-terminal cleavage/methylation domain-containing protein
MRGHVQRATRGFSLVELAVVMAIMALVLGGAMMTLSAQQDARRFADAQQQLEQARELLLAFAATYKRLPCPATAAAGSGDEAPVGGGTCTSYYGGFLPGKAIGFQPVDAAGYALDAWGNRIRYAVSNLTWSTAGGFTVAHVTGNTAAQWSLGNTPGDLASCSTTPAVATSTTCDAGTRLTGTNVVVALVFSPGKNGANGGTGANEARNLDGNALFVSRPPDPSSFANGEFDDQVAWIPVSLLYSRMVSAGVLP